MILYCRMSFLLPARRFFESGKKKTSALLTRRGAGDKLTYEQMLIC